LKEAGLLPAAVGLCQAYVAQLDAALSADCFSLAADLRRAGVNTELAPEPSKMGKQFKYADRAKIRFVLVLGPDEKAKGVVAVKDLQSGQQAEVARSEVAAHLAKLLGP
jgi:histidyl-tRNA synthetase